MITSWHKTPARALTHFKYLTKEAFESNGQKVMGRSNCLDNFVNNNPMIDLELKCQSRHILISSCEKSKYKNNLEVKKNVYFPN